ncbi:PREDICTED: uncharacterized protein LOC105461206 isoform X2 [Wasmannia auropunctata]|uniref:uncharacterized protein LOC105461206 isoform X2 n=1 Tax=Wasmannia auropunctata TaxID=64793 RepID=UPI0005F04A72|nr:PREDICTED: uncharacterized protein LOC105461206 isoform X2 [Wasmannia auropunctata]
MLVLLRMCERHLTLRGRQVNKRSGASHSGGSTPREPFIGNYPQMIYYKSLSIRKGKVPQVQFLMLKCQNDNQNNDVVPDQFVSSFMSSIHELSNQTEVGDDGNSDFKLNPNKTISARSTDENNTFKDIAKSVSEVMLNLFFDSNKRPNLRSEMQNYVTTKNETNSDYGLIKWSEQRARRLKRVVTDSEEQQSEEKGEIRRQGKKENKEQRQIEKEEVLRQNEEIISKTRRQSDDKDRRRQRSGKNGAKRRSGNKRNIQRQCERCHRRCNCEQSSPLVTTSASAIPEPNRGPSVVTFVGAIPESNQVRIGPWNKKETSKVSQQYDFTPFYLTNDSIEVSINGLFFISVQVYYSGNNKDMYHSYWVMLLSLGASAPEKLIKCGSFNIEVSCYTSITTYLQKGDRLYLEQEAIRTVNLEKGYSQIQIVLLSSDRNEEDKKAT